MTFCPLCSSFHLAWKAGMIFPYTSRGVLYAAKVITGDFGVTQAPPDVPPVLVEQAAATVASVTKRTAVRRFPWTMVGDPFSRRIDFRYHTELIENIGKVIAGPYPIPN